MVKLIRKLSTRFYKDSDINHLISQVEVNGSGIILYMRIKDNDAFWRKQYEILKKDLEPNVCHHDDDKLGYYHPAGKPKEHYKYFHHMHSPHSVEKTLDISKEYMTNELIIAVAKDTYAKDR